MNIQPLFISLKRCTILPTVYACCCVTVYIGIHSTVYTQILGVMSYKCTVYTQNIKIGILSLIILLGVYRYTVYIFSYKTGCIPFMVSTVYRTHCWKIHIIYLFSYIGINFHCNYTLFYKLNGYKPTEAQMLWVNNREDNRSCLLYTSDAADE